MAVLAGAGRRSEALAQYAVCRRLLADELGAAPTPETAALAERLRAGGAMCPPPPLPPAPGGALPPPAPTPSPPRRARPRRGGPAGRAGRRGDGAPARPPAGPPPSPVMVLVPRAPAPRRPRARGHNLPAPLTALVGRERELAVVARRLAETRLLTLTGPGGGGKTRLALALAARLAGAGRDEAAPGDSAGGAPACGPGSALYPDGVWLVELAPLADPELVPQAVAAAVGVRETPGGALTDTLCRALRLKRLLLVLDNCEHLLGACAALAAGLLGACPGVRVLATSREPLGLAGEATWWVPPLAWPAGPAGEALPPAALPPPEALLGYGAVRLFVERARDVRPAFALTAANAPAVVRVCERLDGLPLALELAARQAAVLPPAELAARLDARFRLLTGGGPAAHPRQRTLAATLDWSHALLGGVERTLFRRLAVFAGGFDLEAAEAVGADGPGLAGVAEGARAAGAGAAAGPPYGGPLPAAGRPGGPAAPGGPVAGGGRGRPGRGRGALPAAGDGAPVRRRAPGGRRRGAGGGRPPPGLVPRPGPAGRGRAGRADAGRLAGAPGAGAPQPAGRPGLGPAGRLGRRPGPGWPAVALLADARPPHRGAPAPGRPPGGPGLRPRRHRPAGAGAALLGSGALAAAQRDFPAARALLEAALEEAAARGDPAGTARARCALGAVLTEQGDFRGARTLLETGPAAGRGAGDRAAAAEAVAALADLTATEGDFPRAGALYAEAAAAFRALGDSWRLARTLSRLARIHSQGLQAPDVPDAPDPQDDYARAAALYEESLAAWRALGDTEHVRFAAGQLGNLARLRGRPAEARAWLRECLRHADESGTSIGRAAALHLLAHLTAAEGDHARAGDLYEESLALRREDGDAATAGIVLGDLGNLARARGEYARAGTLWRESLGIARARLGHGWLISWSLGNVATLLAEQGAPAAGPPGRGGGGRPPLLPPLDRPGRAGRLRNRPGRGPHRPALWRRPGNRRARLGHGWLISWSLGNVATLLAAEGAPAAAARLAGAAAAAHRFFPARSTRTSGPTTKPPWPRPAPPSARPPSPPAGRRASA